LSAFFAQLLQLVQLLKIRKSELRLEKWKFFPELHVGYLEYLQTISEAMKIKLDFLEALESYNQIALQLEYFIANP
jgi:hypothetical protein